MPEPHKVVIMSNDFLLSALKLSEAWRLIIMKLFKKLAAAGLSVIIAGSLLAGCGSTADTAQIDGTKTVVTINEDEVPLGTLSFLAKYQQAQMYAMYTAYFGAAEIFDMVMDESSGETYGETLKGYALDSIEEMVLLRQHAEEYGVTLTAEEEEQIDKVAQAYIDENSEDVRAAVGASKENVIELLELQPIKSKMLEPMAANVDTEVSDEEAQQSGVTYVKIDKATEADFADENSDESSLADSSVAAAADVAAQVEAANAEKLSQAEAVLAAVQASGNVAEADMTTIANEVNKDLYAQNGQFTTYNTEDTVLDMAIVEAVAGLADGTLVDHVVESSDGTAWFVVRFDAAYDEAATEEIKKEKVTARKQEAYDTLYTEWKDAAKITVDEAVLATLIISDMNPITFGKDVLPEDDSSVAAENTDASEPAAEESVSGEAAESAPADESVADGEADASVAAEESASN